MDTKNLNHIIVKQTPAWLIHIFTSLGVICALLALISLINDLPKISIFWLAISLIIDGIDGTFARKLNVKEKIPHIDGAILDLIIDFLTYVFIPCIFIYLYIPIPEGWLIISLSMILISSLYCFANVNMKSQDFYFVGFPATWNIVALYFYLFNTNQWLNLIIISFLSALTFTKIKFIHPFRVKKLMLLNIIAVVIWFISSVILIIKHPSLNYPYLIAFILSSTYLTAVSALRSLQDYRAASKMK